MATQEVNIYPARNAGKRGDRVVRASLTKTGGLRPLRIAIWVPSGRNR